MSYDIYLRSEACSACGREECASDLPSPTYNLTAIFDAALTGEALPNPEITEAGVVLFGQKTERPRGLRILNGRRAEDTIDRLRKALRNLRDPAQAEKFRALEPSNGWGDLAGAIHVIEALLGAATAHPKMVWKIH